MGQNDPLPQDCKAITTHKSSLKLHFCFLSLTHKLRLNCGTHNRLEDPSLSFLLFLYHSVNMCVYMGCVWPLGHWGAVAGTSQKGVHGKASSATCWRLFGNAPGEYCPHLSLIHVLLTPGVRDHRGTCKSRMHLCLLEHWILHFSFSLLIRIALFPVMVSHKGV